MRFSRMLPILRISILFINCKNGNEFIANETISKEFLQEMNSLDSLHQAIVSSPKIIYQDPSTENSEEVKAAERLATNSEKGIREIAQIQISSEAMPFYNGVLDYLHDTKFYGNNAKKIFQEKDTLRRKYFYDQLGKQYEKLTTKPDSLLAIQKIYHNQVGLDSK